MPLKHYREWLSPLAARSPRLQEGRGSSMPTSLGDVCSSLGVWAAHGLRRGSGMGSGAQDGRVAPAPHGEGGAGGRKGKLRLSPLLEEEEEDLRASWLAEGLVCA